MKSHKFPGNSEAVLIIDHESVFSNIHKLYPASSPLNVGLPPLKLLWEKHSEDFLKAGVGSLYARLPFVISNSSLHNIECFCGPIRFAKDLGFASELNTPIISSYQEALFLSNMGQQMGRNLPFLIYLKSVDNEFNQGNFGGLEIIEKSSSLPNVILKGLFFEEFLTNQSQIERFIKLAKRESDISELFCLAVENSILKSEDLSFISGFDCLGISSSLQFNLAISIGVTAFPVEKNKDGLSCLINLGSQDGLRPGAKIKIENDEIEISEIYSNFSIFTSKMAPAVPPPYNALLVGELGNLQVSHHSWNLQDLKELVLNWKHPIYLKKDGNIEKLQD